MALQPLCEIARKREPARPPGKSEQGKAFQLPTTHRSSEGFGVWEGEKLNDCRFRQDDPVSVLDLLLEVGRHP